MSNASRSLMPAAYVDELGLEPDLTGRFEAMEAPSDRAIELLRKTGRAHTESTNKTIRVIRSFRERISKLDDEWNDRPLRALIVDDYPGMRVAIRAAIEGMFETIDEADDSESAHALTRKHRYDLVIVDVRLSGDETGVELVGRIRQRSHRPMVPILMISGKTPGDAFGKLEGDELMKWSDRSGANDYLEKGFEESELQIKVRKLLSEARPQTRLRKR